MKAWLGCLFAAAALHAAPAPREGSFPLRQAGRTITVWYHRPAGLAADAPVVFVMHGIKRNGHDYLNDWAPYSERDHFLLVVPEFSAKEFPGDEGYIYGNTVDPAGKPVPREKWSFSVIEPAFDAVRAQLGSTAGKYCIFGHSAGAQFVQRLVYFVPNARIERAVAGNAGWYMMPDLRARFPYGLAGTPVTATDLQHAFSVPLTILLGTADTNPNDRVLRKSAEAEAQGPYRFARGRYFFAHATDAAAALHADFRWSLAEAPGIGHSDSGMAPFGVAALFHTKPEPLNHHPSAYEP
jgi:poly(3-hydroxybutyrate) depolymerase